MKNFFRQKKIVFCPNNLIIKNSCFQSKKYYFQVFLYWKFYLIDISYQNNDN